MPEAADQPAPEKHGKSLAGFYIAVGVVATLFGLGVWLWTPARICYWQYKLCQPLKPLPPETDPSFQLEQIKRLDEIEERERAAEELVKFGPRALPALRRGVINPSFKIRYACRRALEKARATWALPLLVEACEHWCDPEVQHSSIERIIGKSIGGDPVVCGGRASPEEQYRTIVLDWWEREGQAKYGRPQK